MSTCHIDTPQSDLKLSNATVANTLLICKSGYAENLYANAACVNQLKAGEIITESLQPDMADILVPPAIIFLAQMGNQETNQFNQPDWYFSAGQANGGMVQGPSPLRWIFTAPCAIREFILNVYSDGDSAAVGFVTVEPQDPTGSAALPGTAIPADLGTTAAPAWGIARYVLDTPLNAGDQFTIRMETTLTAQTKMRGVLNAICFE